MWCTKIRAPYTKLRAPHTKLRAPHTKIRAPHTKLRAPHTKLKALHTKIRTPHTTHFGTFKFKLAPMGLHTSPNRHHLLMDKHFMGLNLYWCFLWCF
jgi:hypothetical protein